MRFDAAYLVNKSCSKLDTDSGGAICILISHKKETQKSNFSPWKLIGKEIQRLLEVGLMGLRVVSLKNIGSKF